jgi:hypothetical protein
MPPCVGGGQSRKLALRLIAIPFASIVGCLGALI